MMKASDWFEEIYAGENTAGWLVQSPEEATKLIEGMTGRQFRSRVHSACCYSPTGPVLDPIVLGTVGEARVVAFAAWMLSYYAQREDALDLLANGLVDSEGLRKAYDLSFRFTAEGGRDA